MINTAFAVITAIGAIGSFITAMLALIKAVPFFATASFKEERLYGREAEERYNALLARLPEKAPGAFGPDEYSGGNKSTPQFEVERFNFDRQTMPDAWEKFTRTVRYYYKQNGTILVRGWRL